MPRGRVNTLMAGAGKAQRGHYTSAGYAYEEQERESELYLERDRAEFARELIRDNHRVGYSAQELDEDGLPFSFFIDEAQRDEERARQKKRSARARQAQEELTFTERLAIAMRRERCAAAVCCVLLALNATLLAFWGQAMIDGVEKRNQIEAYEDDIAGYQAEIETARKAIDAAQRGDRIRNVAQNELGMLREELVTKQTIYIQAPSAAADRPQQTQEQERTGLLDWLLSAADIFDFKR